MQTNTYQANTRNKLIAEAFYLTGDIEKYGSGFRRIRNEIKQYPTMKLECAEIANGFLATISYTERKITTKTDLKTDLKRDSIDDKIIFLITENKQITIPEIAKNINLSISGTKLRISKLKNKAIIERKDSKKGGYWNVINK